MEPTIHPAIVRSAIAAGIQKKHIAERAGITRQALTGVSEDSWNPRWSTLVRLCEISRELVAERQAELAEIAGPGAAVSSGEHSATA